MNARIARQLRTKLDFHPGDERKYKVTGRTGFFLGHVVSTGARRRYQAVKRNPALRARILAAKIVGGAV